MKKETFKDWCKGWTIKQIVGDIFSSGMEFMARSEQTNVDTTKYKKIMVKEIKRRIKLNHEKYLSKSHG